MFLFCIYLIFRFTIYKKGYLKVYAINIAMERPLCQNCRVRPAAINYKRKGKTYYRRYCGKCLKKEAGVNPDAPRWMLSGYKKKKHCELCNFVAVTPNQLFVFYLDGNMKNNNWSNLKTVCANCAIALYSNKTTWVTGDISADI